MQNSLITSTPESLSFIIDGYFFSLITIFLSGNNFFPIAYTKQIVFRAQTTILMKQHHLKHS